MQQLLKPGETSAFQLGKNDYALVQNCIVIDSAGSATVVTVQQKIGPFIGGANLRAIGSAGGGSLEITDFAYDDRPTVSRDANGDINGLIDPRNGSVVAFGAGSVTPDATSVANGKLRLAGALGGSAAAPSALGYLSAAAFAVAFGSKADQSAVDYLQTQINALVAGGGGTPAQTYASQDYFAEAYAA